MPRAALWRAARLLLAVLTVLSGLVVATQALTAASVLFKSVGGAYAYDDVAQVSWWTHGSSNLSPPANGVEPRSAVAVFVGAMPAAASRFAAEGEGFVQSAGSSKLLGQNLEASGVARPAETAAHHIVAGGAEAAAPARGVLTQYGIDVNSAENGVFLPRNLGSENPFGAAVHSTLHTGGYYESVNEMLLGANSAGEVMDTLAYLRAALLGGGL